MLPTSAINRNTDVYVLLEKNVFLSMDGCGLKEPVEVVYVSDWDVSLMDFGEGDWEEATGHTPDSVERLYLSAGLGKPQCFP